MSYRLTPTLISKFASVKVFLSFTLFRRFKSELLSFDKNEDGYLLTQDQLLKFTGQKVASPCFSLIADFYLNLEAYHGKDNAANPEVSPLLSESFEGLPRAYLQTAGRDMLRDEVILYEKLLRDAGVPTKLDM